MIKSPCVRSCALNKQSVCVGCGMTVRDIRIWRSASDEEKREILRQSSIRASSMQEMRDQGFRNDREE
jgi:predicted Fe-S protein YdhL (DUF1289 family)